MRPPVTEHVSLHSNHVKLLHVRLGGAKNMCPISWGAQTKKIQHSGQAQKIGGKFDLVF